MSSASAGTSTIAGQTRSVIHDIISQWPEYTAFALCPEEDHEHEEEAESERLPGGYRASEPQWTCSVYSNATKREMDSMKALIATSGEIRELLEPYAGRFDPIRDIRGCRLFTSIESINKELSRLGETTDRTSCFERPPKFFALTRQQWLDLADWSAFGHNRPQERWYEWEDLL